MNFNLKFQKSNGERITNVGQYIKDYIANDIMTSEFHIFIGCDSLPRMKNSATYVTAICIYRVGRGAHIIFAKENKIRTNSFRERLWNEVYRAVHVAGELDDAGIINCRGVSKFEIHLDLNPNENYESNVIHDEALGYARQLGFDAYAKPESPAASYASDHICRGFDLSGGVK